MLGSFSDVYAAEKHSHSLLNADTEKHDARSVEKKLVQIKITQTDRVSIYSEPDYLIVLKMDRDGSMKEVCNGKEVGPWTNAGMLQENGQRSISLKKSISWIDAVPSEDRKPRLRQTSE